MPIYEQPTKVLMQEFADARLSKDQVFGRSDAVTWFTKNYPKIKAATVRVHVDGMSVNSTTRRHHPSIKPGSGHDLFFKIDSTRFRLWDRETDPAPVYKDAPDPELGGALEPADELEHEGDRKFAFERDLQNYLVKNLSLIEQGLRVYEEEEISGIEFPADGRFIDVLAVDRNDDFVVIELKVSKAYDRVVGQILRYMAWVKANLADGRQVRGVIIGSQISQDLKLAASLIPGLRLMEYELSFSLKPVP